MRVNKNIIGGLQYVLPYTPVYKYKLDVIENFFGMCEQLQQVLSVSKPHVYPYQDDNFTALLGLIATYTGADRANIIITNGSDNALKLLMEAYITPESRVLVPIPTYPHFLAMAKTMYRQALDYCTIEALDEQLAMAKHLNADYDLVYIASPNIPIGYCFDIGHLQRLLETCPNTMFIIDEAYFEFGTGNSAIGLLQHGFKNLSVTRTFSKTFGLAGLRIGYLITDVANVAHLKVLHNDKNITDLAVRAAKTVLENIDFYIKIVERVNIIKAWLAAELDTIVAPDAPITGYNIQYGNFFMIRAADPGYVCDVFAQHGVYIRNKDSELPGCIRITIGTHTMMEDVIGIIRMINVKHVIRSSRVAFDLDGTLRKNAKLDSWYDLRGLQLTHAPYVITNNNIPTTELRTMLQANGLDVLADRIITPTYGFTKLLTTPHTKAFLVDSVNFGMRQIERCSNLLHNGYTLAYADSSRFCTFDGCSETAETGLILMPDLATLVQAFAPLGRVELVGKPSKWMIPDDPVDIYVGDTDTDCEFARVLDAHFIRVKSDVQSPRYDFDTASIIIPDITWLM